MKPLGLSINRLALDLHVPVSRVGEIVHRERGITSDTALRLARYFRTSPEYWLNLQATEHQTLKAIQREVRPRMRAAG